MNAVARKKIKDFNVFALKSEEVIRKFIEPANDFPEFPESEIRQSIVARFNKQVELYPNRIAVSVEKQELTYEELNRLSNRIGRTLCSNFGESRGSVALLFEHDAEMVAGMLGVLKSGNFYIPLDPTYPPKRLSYILKDSDTGVLLTNDKNMDMAGRLIEDARTPVMVINIADIGTNVPGDNLHVDIKPDSLAYILYTSGSTGFPKGVLQNHRNVLHFIRVYTNNLHIHPEDKLTLFSSYSFDAAVMDIYGAVLTGAALYPYDIKNTGNLNNMAA